MRIRKPSPSMVISLVALVMASTGTAIAAVNFARNAGAVDHKSAVGASKSRARAAGKLVATRASGPSRGKIPSRFLSGVPSVARYERTVNVADNTQGADFTLATTRLGKLTASCDDQSAATGDEDPKMTFTFTNSTGSAVNFGRSSGSGSNQVVSVGQGTQAAFTHNGSVTFRVRVEQNGVDVIYDGQFRQDGRGTASARCFVAGIAETFAP